MNINNRAAGQTLYALGVFTLIFTYLGWLFFWPLPTVLFTLSLIGTYQYFLRFH